MLKQLQVMDDITEEILGHAEGHSGYYGTDDPETLFNKAKEKYPDADLYFTINSAEQFQISYLLYKL